MIVGGWCRRVGLHCVFVVFPGHTHFLTVTDNKYHIRYNNVEVMSSSYFAIFYNYTTLHSNMKVRKREKIILIYFDGIFQIIWKALQVFSTKAQMYISKLSQAKYYFFTWKSES